MNKLVLFFLVLMILLAACNINQVVSTEILTKEVSTPQVTVTHTNTVISHPTSTLSPSPTKMPTIQFSPTPEIELIEENIEIEKIMNGQELNGRIVLRGGFVNCCDKTTTPIQYPSYIWDLDSGNKWEISISPYDEISSIAISPSRKSIVYFIKRNQSNRQEIELLDYNGRLISKTDITLERWWNIYGWLDDECVIITALPPKEAYYELAWILVVYNPSTKQILDTYSVRDYPDVDVVNQAYQWGEYSYCACSYSPIFDKVVYKQDEPYMILLWNEETQEPITQFNTGSPYSGPPSWSSDGTFFIIDGFIKPELYKFNDNGIIFMEELFKISNEGSVERLTNLLDLFDSVEISSPSLSPDNQKIAFNLATDSEHEIYNLAVYNLANNSVSIFSSISPYRFRDYVEYLPPVWSPDSTQIMMVVDYEQERHQTILIDLNEKFAIEIIEDTIPIGWMYDNSQGE